MKSKTPHRLVRLDDGRYIMVSDIVIKILNFIKKHPDCFYRDIFQSEGFNENYTRRIVNFLSQIDVVDKSQKYDGRIKLLRLKQGYQTIPIKLYNGKTARLYSGVVLKQLDRYIYLSPLSYGIVEYLRLHRGVYDKFKISEYFNTQHSYIPVIMNTLVKGKVIQKINSGRYRVIPHEIISLTEFIRE